MATTPVQRFEKLNEKAKEYHNSAQWEEKLRVLQEVLQICDRPDFPDATTNTRRVLIEMSGIQRRLGRCEQGLKTLERRLQVDQYADAITRAKIVGEMSVMHRHSNNYEKARDLSLQQYALASQGKGLEADAQMCQAIGNAAMASYNLAIQQQPYDAALLSSIIEQFHDRVQRARNLQRRILNEDPKSSYLGISKQWETIGMNRLILGYILKGETRKAIAQAEDTLQHQHTEDPNVRAFTSFFCGYAFWADGQREIALRHWRVPQGTTTPAMAFCKEASKEHVGYLRLLAEAGMDFDSYDEQGFTALDFAVLSESPDAKVMCEIILKAFRKSLNKGYMSSKPQLKDIERENEVNAEVTMRYRQSLLRREYRSILQEHIRPTITNEKDSIKKIRSIYDALLEADPTKRAVLDAFYYVRYSDFKALGRMPRNDDRLAMRFNETKDGAASNEGQFIIFLSYRQLGMSRTPPKPEPDDDNHTQYNRMNSALEAYLSEHREIDPEQMCLWLDCACIDQIDLQKRERGINALPFAVIQCDAMISLIDDAYWTRAWCGVEVMMMRELQQAYKIHSWSEHRLHNQHTSRICGSLHEGTANVDVDLSILRLTNEKLDRPKVNFLLRQSKLLGKDFV